MSVDCHFLELPAIPVLPIDGSSTVLKSHLIIIFVSEKLFGVEKNVWKKEGSSEFGP